MTSGIFERLMRSVKELSKKDMRNYKITLNELQTVLLEIELIIKNCPYPYLHRLRRTIINPKSTGIFEKFESFQFIRITSKRRNRYL